MQFLLGSLAICNIGLALGMFAYTFLVDVYYHVDSFDTLLALNSGPESANGGLWHFAKVGDHWSGSGSLISWKMPKWVITDQDY